jgi:peptidoglycan/LPS O-acetylase OafA/YrhL
MGRLFPALFVCSLLTVLLKKAVPDFVPPGRGVSWFDWVYTPFSFATVGILNISYRPADGAYWSLQVEFTFYLLYAAILLFGLKRYAVPLFSWFLLVFAITLGHETQSTYDFFPCFLAGMSVASLVSGNKSVGYLGLGSAFLADFIFLRKGFHQLSINVSALRTLVLWGSTLAIWFAATYRPTAATAKFLRPLAFIGLISYPLYLLHQDIMLVLYNAFGLELRIGTYRRWQLVSSS